VLMPQGLDEPLLIDPMYLGQISLVTFGVTRTEMVIVSMVLRKDSGELPIDSDVEVQHYDKKASLQHAAQPLSSLVAVMDHLGPWDMGSERRHNGNHHIVR